MALTAYGFTGKVTNQQWARLTSFAGEAYDFGGTSHFRVESVAGQDRTVRVLPGTAFGHGVLVDSDANVTVQLPTIASGTRQDLIVLRRNWTGLGSVAVTYVEGNSTLGALTGRNANPGTLDDQPLALVRVTAGQTLPTLVQDYRDFPSKVHYVQHLEAIVSPRPGDEAVVRGFRWRWEPDTNGSFGWRADPSAGGRVNRNSTNSSDLVNGNVFSTVVTYGAPDMPPGQYLVNFQVSASKATTGEATITLRVPGMIDSPFTIYGGATDSAPRRQLYSVTSLITHPGGAMSVPCQIQPSAGGVVFTNGTHVIVTRAG